MAVLFDVVACIVEEYMDSKEAQVYCSQKPVRLSTFYSGPMV